MNKLIQQLNYLVQQQQLELKKSNRFSDNRIAATEIVRCLDHSSVSSFLKQINKVSTEEDIERERLFGTGFYEALKLFLDSSIKESGFPLFAANQQTINWINQVLINSGYLGYTKRLIKLTEQGLFKVSKLGNEYLFINQTENPGREALGVEDFLWWQGHVKSQESDKHRMLELEPIIEKQLFEEVEVWKDYFIKYGCTQELDEFYELSGKDYRIRYHSNDAFPIDSKFGDLNFGEIISIMEALIGYSIKHKDHCLALLKKTNYKINPWNIHTLPYRLDDLANSVSIHKKLNFNSVYNFLENITLNDENIEILGRDAGVSTPPTIRISKELVLRSAAGTLINPFSYLVRALKLNYERDYSIAVNKREDVYKKELYQLFPAVNIFKTSSNINLKQAGKLVTDIDAMLFDKETRTLILVQLKWYDDFGPSMQARNSMAHNFMTQAVKWIEKVSEWIENNDPKVLLNRLDKNPKIENQEISNIHLWILGRNFSHFSDKEEDKRAVWCSWYRLFRVIHENPHLNNNLNLLSDFLRKNSLQHQSLPNTGKQTFQLGRYKISSLILE
ncbi:hypothetical protein D1614_09210 [Maribellus luteus]|uniref:Uncharacterized protein n=1 Tax=Maribellus luteus TaxID=2305463 RepID=A0A399T3D7_9BACT|nr:hypothetical protein [Maribellus luteus]RIJ48701.1 hypothetical protein D1614_09210 [Maribellus luteus]